MHSPRFTPPYCISRQNQWRPHGPRFGLVWPMQNNNNINTHNFPNNNENHWCETCDRGFRTVEILLNHKQQHQKCNIDGCQFIAHPKVITKHIQMQHSTGLYKKIAKLDSPEEIQKWREERKKKYPTKENIEKRNAEIREKIDRGEKMGMRSHKDNKLKGRERGIKRKYRHDTNKKNFKRRFQAKKSFMEANKTLGNDNNIFTIQPQTENKFIPKVDDSKSLKPFTGILYLLDDINNDDVDEDIQINDCIEDDEYVIMNEFDDKNKSNITEPPVCGALSSLICNYESSDEEKICDAQTQNNYSENLEFKNNASEEDASKVEPSKGLSNKTNIKNDSEKSDDSGPEEIEIVKTMNTESNTVKTMNTGNNTGVHVNGNEEALKLESSKKVERKEREDKNRMNKSSQQKIKSKLPSTLLEKLLRNEIRQERNIILQCIRYIVKNNYFEK